MTPADLDAIETTLREVYLAPSIADAFAALRQERDSHCVDCCCARSWDALGVSEYDGKSIPEHITALRAERYALREVVAAADAIAQSMSEGLETEGNLEHDWSIQDRALIAAYDAARAALKEPK